MNPVEIEEAVSALAEQPFDSLEFPYAFLQAFGNKDATIRRLRSGDTNESDVGGVLQRNNVHLAVAPAGEVPAKPGAGIAAPATDRPSGAGKLNRMRAMVVTHSDSPPTRKLMPLRGSGLAHFGNYRQHYHPDKSVHFGNFRQHL